jgi:spore coat polysaccharide biosynthesis predicted glycosyltransferase SpsG
MNAGPLLRVLIVCRGSRQDGLGHVMRARCVAAELSRRASVRLVVVGEAFVSTLLAGRGINHRIIASEADLPAIEREYRPHVVVFDALRIDEAVFRGLRAGRIAVSLSPVFDRLADVDLLFHRTMHAAGDWAPGPEIRRGLDYAVIREQCLPIDEASYARSLSQDPLSVVISMGGADAHDKTLATLRALGDVPCPLLIWTLLGEGYEHSYERLVDCVRSHPQHEVILAKTSDSMWRVMQTAALAVLAGGTVTYEAAFAGLPSINVFDKAAHVFLIRELVEKGICINAGHPFEDALDVVVATVAHLEAHREELLAMHRRARGAIDGRGAARIAEEIVAYASGRRSEGTVAA